MRLRSCKGGNFRGRDMKTTTIGVRAWAAAACLLAAVAVSGCAMSTDPVIDIPDTASFATEKPVVLREGAQVRVVVFGSDTLSGTYAVHGGKLHLAGLGAIPVAGLTAPEVEQAIVQRLAARGQKDARVSVLID